MLYIICGKIEGDLVNKKVYVSIVGSSYVDEENDTTELVTEGEFIKRNDKYLLRYKEQISEEDEMCSTIVKFDDKNVVMTRTGAINTQMIFENGKRHISHYETPMGSFTIGVRTDNMNIQVDDSGGNIEISYVLDINSSAQIHNKLHLNIRGERI